MNSSEIKSEISLSRADIWSEEAHFAYQFIHRNKSLEYVFRLKKALSRQFSASESYEDWWQFKGVRTFNTLAEKRVL